MMLVSFLTAGITGIVVGCFFRAGALIVVSFGFLVYAAIAVHGWNATSPVAAALALLATVQIGYICGVAISGFRKKKVRTLGHRPWVDRSRAECRKSQSMAGLVDHLPR
jgi:hypothetical protein